MNRNHDRIGVSPVRLRLLAGAALVPLALLGSTASAQTVTLDPPPVRTPLDENGVDLASGRFVPPSSSIKVGDDASGMVHTRYRVANGWRHNYILTVVETSTTATVSIGGASWTFTPSGSNWVSDQKIGDTLVETTAGYTFTTGGGTVYYFSKSIGLGGYYGNVSAIGTTITEPDGKITTLTYKSADYSKWIKNGTIELIITAVRLQSVNGGTGFQLKLAYADNTLEDVTVDNWLRITKVTAINNAVEYCDPTADTCTLSGAWPYLAYDEVVVGTGKQETVTDALNRQARFTSDSSKRITGIKRPSETSDSTTVVYDTSNRVTSITRPLVPVRTYAWTTGTNQLTSVSNDSLGRVRTVVASTTGQAILSDKNALNQTVAYAYDTNGRLLSVTQPEGNLIQYTYDARGNVIEVRKKPKTGSTEPDLVTSSTYAATCSNAITCNNPLTTTDVAGQVTTYVWNATHGGLDKFTSPAAAAGGPQPEARNTYITVQARYLTAPGTYTNSGNIVRLNQASTCRSGTATSGCIGTANETVSQVLYPSGTLPNNAQPISSIVRAGDSSVSATTTVAYGLLGEVQTVDGPLTGTTDTARYRYDAALQLTGVVAPDPDGASARVPMAARLTYNLDGQVTQREVGTVADQTDSSWASFASAQQEVTTYDSAGRPIKLAQSGGGVTTSVTQQSYDSGGRPDCSVVRMDPAQWAGQSDACAAQTTGLGGPDRIIRPAYDILNRVVTASEGVGTSEAAVSLTKAYATAANRNGQLVSVKDGENNLTTYEYDGHDRQYKTRYPLPTKGSNASSTADYEQLTYDTASRVTQLRQRDGSTIALTYDNLSRVTSLTPAGDPVANLTYNLLGAPTVVSRPADGVTQTYSYDGLGRLLSEAQAFGTIAYQYDAASRRTRMTWGDGVYASYDYDVTSHVTAIRENGAASGIGVLATYAYDSLGRRTGVTYGNGTSRAYGYDAASRLEGIKIDLAGTAQDLLLGKVAGVGASMAYNSASQITSIARSNDAYAWGQHYNVDRPYTSNGLNQYTSNGTSPNVTSFGFDGRGNLTTSGTSTYTYSKLNELKTAPGVTMGYDGLGRLIEYNTSISTRFLYDGGNMIAELANPSGAILRRYVPGPGSDETVVWYEGAGLTDRRFLQADERGSVVAISDGSGAAIASNRYDEYGIPQSTNIGRFQYTGQAWLPELGMHYYKARMYSPGLGRFMQTDPIGYGDGLNWYNYVGGDPVNRVDPSGMIYVIANCTTSFTASSVTVDGSAAMIPHTTCTYSSGSGGDSWGSGFGGGHPRAFERPERGESGRQNGDFHYKYEDFAFCSADSLFAQFSKPGNSAPGAPAAQPGTTPDIVLTGGNPITQVVNPGARTITNITQEGHRYHSGTVEIRISPTWYGSSVSIEGRGTTSRYWENSILGKALFTALSTRATIACTVGAK